MKNKSLSDEIKRLRKGAKQCRKEAPLGEQIRKWDWFLGHLDNIQKEIKHHIQNAEKRLKEEIENSRSPDGDYPDADCVYPIIEEVFKSEFGDKFCTNSRESA